MKTLKSLQSLQNSLWVQAEDEFLFKLHLCLVFALPQPISLAPLKVYPEIIS